MLAIIIPYFKLTFFEETLLSLAKQTDKRFKVYIGDDASPENPTNLLEKYKGKFEFIYHRFEDNLGGTSLTQQWDRCIALSADEKWIMILGDDDELDEHCLADFYRNLANIIIAKSNVVRYATRINDILQLKKSDIFTHPQLEKATDFFFRRISNQTRSSLSEYIFKRASFEKYGFVDYDLAWHSDDRAWFEFSENSPIFTINTSCISFRLSGENISRADYKIKEKQQISLIFFRFMLKEYFSIFSNEQKRYFLLHYEQMIYSNKKVTISFWFLIFRLFLSIGSIKQSVKFSRRVFIHLFQ
jgi:glycosyltransferase involved in cell wall biosynthesis